MFHYVAFTKIPWDCSRLLCFLNVPHSSQGANHPKESEPHTPSLIDGTTAKQIAPQFL
jgi:hypothetical protein